MRIILMTFGSLIGLVAIALIACGGLLLWFNSVKTDDEGFYTTKTKRFESTSYAIATEGIDIDIDVPDWVRDWWFDPHNFTNAKLAGSNNNPSEEVFIGLAKDSDVKTYLAGVEYDEIARLYYGSLQTDFRIDYERHNGGAIPATPTSQTFWEESVHGTGTQALTLTLETGVWSVVIMNADGSAGVDIDGSFGMAVPFVFRLGLGLLLGGVFVMLIATGMVVLGVRR